MLLYFAILCTVSRWVVISPPLSVHPHQQTRELQYQAQPVDWSGTVSGNKKINLKKQKTFMKHGPYRDTGVGNNCVCGIYTPKLQHCPQWLVTIQLWLWDLDSPFVVEYKATQGAMVINATSLQGLKLAIYMRLISAEPDVAHHLMCMEVSWQKREGS